MKALPEDPDAVTRAVEDTLPRQEKERSEPPVEQRYEAPRPAPASHVPASPVPASHVIARKPIGSQDSPQESPKPRPRVKKTPPAPIKTSDKLGNFIRSASTSALSPRNLTPKILSPKLPKDGKSESDGNPESKPQSTLKRARSKLLKRKSIGSLGEKFKAQKKEDQIMESPSIAELSAADSAYSSGTDGDKRPNTSPGPSLRPPANFALFPASPSFPPSLNSPRSISSNHDTDKESVIMALPPMPAKPPIEPSPLRVASAPTPGTLKKKGSLTSLLRFFKKQKSERPAMSPASLTVTSPIYELA
jgi:hypothetical protein